MIFRGGPVKKITLYESISKFEFMHDQIALFHPLSGADTQQLNILFRLKGQLTYYEPFPRVMEYLTQFLCHFCIERNSINLFECCFFRQQNAAGQSLLSLKIL